MKNDNLVEEIKSKLDIVDLVSEHVDLKRAGQNYKGLCPFHSEKTPSFMVSPAKQIFHCFGCHKGGDIFAFVMNYENLSFQEAVSFLADKTGLRVEDFHKGQKTVKGFKDGLFAIYKDAADFFKNNLSSSKQTMAYLKERGLNSGTIEKFSLGYSGAGRDGLFTHLKANGFQPEVIKASGLVYFGENGTHDFFRDRLMFPIFDLQGRVIAFGGRILSSSKNAPKYLNSQDSPVFKKGETVYGLNFAKNSVTQKGYSIITEGYLDAIMCHQYGLDNAVAPLGTALTSGHLKKLRKFSNKVVLVFDGDSAGVSATKRSLELVYSEGVIAKVLLLPEGEDPDTFLRKEGVEKFRQAMGRAITPVDFILKIYGRNKLDAVRYMLHIASLCPDSLQKDETLRELAEKSKINELTLRGELKNIGKKKDAGVLAGKNAGSLNGINSNEEEEILLNIALSMPEKAREILSGIDMEQVETQMIKGLFGKIASVLEQDGDNKHLTEKLMEICDSEERVIITRLSINLKIDEEQVDRNIVDCLRKIAINRLEKQIKSAQQAGSDERVLQRLFSEKNKIISQRTF